MSYTDNAIENANALKVDLSKAVKGSKATFRCGGTAIIESKGEELKEDYGRYKISWADNQGHSHHADNGHITSFMKHPFDIIKIEPPEFDWAAVKPGMAFKDSHEQINWYIGPRTSDSYVLAETKNVNAWYSSNLGWNRKADVIRAPEYDIEFQP